MDDESTRVKARYVPAAAAVVAGLAAIGIAVAAWLHAHRAPRIEDLVDARRALNASSWTDPDQSRVIREYERVRQSLVEAGVLERVVVVRDDLHLHSPEYSGWLRGITAAMDDRSDFSIPQKEPVTITIWCVPSEKDRLEQLARR